jgi:cytidyltransferase-like protein
LSKPVLTILSGFFSPLHIGHLDMIEAAAAHGDQLVVIVNNNGQQTLKKGRVIMDEQDRLRIVRALRVVDDAFIAVDEDRTVCASLVLLAEKHRGTYQMVFANGGDRVSGEVVPESPVCQEHGINMVFGMGGTAKADSSTRINMALGLETEPSATPSATT